MRDSEARRRIDSLDAAPPKFAPGTLVHRTAADWDKTIYEVVRHDFHAPGTWIAWLRDSSRENDKGNFGVPERYLQERTRS